MSDIRVSQEEVKNDIFAIRSGQEEFEEKMTSQTNN
jgi:hypothetical protein